MPDFKELVKNLYATKGRELTEEKLSYIETNYGKGKEEEFVKNFYATIGEELPQDKFDYIRDTYLKKKEDGGIPYRTPSAPVAPSFGTPSVVEASEQLESQSKLTPPRIKGVSVKSPDLAPIGGEPKPTESQLTKDIKGLSAGLWASKPESKKIIEQAQEVKPFVPAKQAKTQEDIVAEDYYSYFPERGKMAMPNRLKKDFVEYLKVNPEQGQKLKQWSKYGDKELGEGNQYEVFNDFITEQLKPKVEELKQLDAEGVGEKFKKVIQLSEEVDKIGDNLKKAQVELNFFNNTYLKQKGYEDVVSEAKALKTKIDSFDFSALQQIQSEISKTEQELTSLVNENNEVPVENQSAYSQIRPKYESLIADYNQILNSPEYKDYQNTINQYNENIEKQKLLVGDLESNKKYQEAKNNYNAYLEQYQKKVGEIEQAKKDKPLFDKYSILSKQVVDLQNEAKNLNQVSFPTVVTRQEVQKKADELDKMGEGQWFDKSDLMNIGEIFQSVPKAANTLLQGISSTLAKVESTIYGESDKERYNLYDKMADYYGALNEYSTYITPNLKSIDKDNNINWANIGFEGLQQLGNMAVMATAGGGSKPAMVASGYFASRSEREREADEAGLKGLEKEAYVSTLSLLEGASELIMPDRQFLTRDIKKLLLKEAVRAQQKGIGWFRQRALAVILENMGKEAAEEYIVKLGELMQKAAINYSSGAVFDLKEYKNWKEWLRTGIVAAPLAGISTAASQRGVPKQELEAAQYEAAKNITESRKILDDLVDGGKITKQQADENYKQIARYAAVQRLIPKDISNLKAIQIVPFLEENERLEMMIDSGISDAFKPSIKKKIEDNINKIQEILVKTDEEIKQEKPKEEYDRAKEPIIGRTDVTQEGLGVATETGTQGVTREGVPSEEVEAKRADIERRRQEEFDRQSSGNTIIAADYLFTGGRGVMLSTDYLLQALIGSFPAATKKINEIRSKYASKIGNIRDDVNTSDYNAMMEEVRSAINATYENKRAEEIFNKILENPTGFTVREGNAISSELDLINEENDKRINAKYDDELAALEGVKPTPTTEEKVSDALKDVESTARALEGVDAKEIEQKVLPNIIDIYKIQDDGAERILERSFKPNRVWVYKIENAGDIIRELSKYKNEFLDPSYIYEKVNKIEKFLKEQQNQLKVSPEDSYFQFKRQNEESVKDFISAYENLPTISEAQSVAKKMVLDLLNGNIDEAQKGIDYFNEIRKADDIKAELQKRNKYQISEAYHNAKAKPEAQRSASDNELITSVETLLKPKEYATQEIKQPKGVRTEPEGGIKGGETKTPSVSDSVQRTKESEKEREVRGEKPPTPEIKAEEVVVKEGKGSWRNEFNKTKNIARKNQILETIAESKTSTEQELRDVYEAAKNTEKETNRINYALANNENTPQDIFDEIITSDKLKKTTGDSAIIELKNKRNGISKTQSEKSDTFAVQRKTSIDTEGADANARNEAKRAEVKSALTKLRDEGLLKTADKSLIGKAKKMLGVKSAAMSDAEIDAQMALMDAMAIVWKKTTGNDNFYETFIADIKKGDLAELKKMGGALFQDSENPKKPSSRITLAVFDAPQFEKMKGLQVTPQSISDLVKGRGKQIEKDIINMVLDYDKYKGQKRISFDEFRGDVETQIMKLEKIRTRSYADYGYDNLGDNENYGQTETVIFNSPIEHGEKGHFSGDFTTEGLDKIEWELRQIPNTDKWAAVDKNMPSNVTANNLSEYIGTAGEKIEVEKWIADRDKENNGGLNKGLFGHIRKWFNKRTGVFNIAELQSDYYQKNKASDLLKPEVSSEEVDAHMNKNVWLPMDKEISEKIKKDWGITVKKTDDSFIAYDKDGKELSSIFFRETPSVGLNKGDFEENQVVVSALRKLSERRANDEKLEDGTYKVTITEFGEGVDEFYFKTYTEAENFIKINDGRFNGAQDDYNSIRSDYQEKRQKIRQIEEQKFIQNRQAELEKTKPVNIQLKQFVASQKVHELRLLREAIKMAADEGAETVRFPSQYTLAVIEGYVDATGEGRAPYEVVSGDYDRLYEGDIINYGGDDMIVVEQDRSTITVAPKDEVSVFNIYDLVEDETTNRVDEIEYEAKRSFVNIDAITREEVESYEPSEWMGEYAKLLLEEYFQENESEETVRWKDISSDLYDKVRLSYDSMDVEDILSWSGKIWQDGDTIYAIEGRNYETFSQPDEYEPSSTEEDYYDNLSSEQRTVVDKYGELGKQFEKMRPDSRVVRDDNGMVWLETTITEEDKNNPIVAFQEEGGKVKGAIDFTNNNKATLYIFDGADISTLAHEMSGHLGRRVLERLAEVNPDFAKQYEAVKKWAGVKDVWTTKAEEKFARAFERYLRNGVAPTKALKEVFSKLKEWLSNVYKVIKNSSIDINLTNDVRETFEALLGKEMFKTTAKERVEQVEPTEAEAVTPTKAERKAIASAKIDEIANALKDILPKIEGEKLGVGQDEIIDVIAKAVKALVNTGIEIDEAIKQVKARLSEAFDGVEGISDTDIKDRMKVTERLTPKSREEQNQKAQSYGFKNASHALNSVNKETGESYEKLSDVPDSVLEEVAKKKAKIETPKGKRRFTQQFIKQYPELAEMLSEDIVNYAKMPNNISVDMANAFIEEVGLEEARAAFADMSSGLPSGARMTLGQLVIKKLEEAGRVDEAIDVLEQVTTRATEMGQEIQALSMWAFLTPQGQLRYAQKTVNKAVERRKKQDKSKTDKLKEKLKKANQEAIDETLQDPKVRGLIEKTDSIIPKGLPTPETKKPKKYIVSDDRVAFLKKQIKGKLFSGIPTELIELGVAYVERGAYKFSDFSRAMIKEFGNKIKPYLKEVYTKATETLIKEDYDKSNFDSADNIDKQVAQQKADEAVEKVEKAIKAGNKKALAQAIVNLQKVAKQNGLWGQYKKYAVSRLKQLTIQNISDDVKKNPPLDEFTKGLVQNIKSMMMEKAEPKEREKIAKRPAIEVIADAFKNPEAYKEVLEETQKEMRKKYNDDVESLEMLDEYFGEFFDKPFSSKLVGTAIKEAMKEMNITISDIVTSHYTVYDATKKSLVDKLVEQAGLSESEASVLAKAIEKEFDKIATEKKQKLLEKILSNKKRKTPEAKSLEQELIRLTNLGAFSDSDVMSKWAEKMGYPKLTQEQVKEIQKLADAVQRAGKGFERFRAIEDLLSYQANLKGVSQLDVAISIWYANILSGFTTQTINTVANLLNSAILYGNAVAQNPKNAKFIASGFIEGFKRGLIEAKETFRTGYSPIRGKVEVPPVLERVKFEGFSKPLEYAKFIGRLMKAADVLVFEALKEMRAYQLAAKQAAKTSALEPSQSIKDKSAEILGKSDYIIEEATETAELWYENKVEEINESNLSKEEKEKALKQAKIDKQRKLYEYLEEQRSPEFQSEVADYAASGTYNKKPDGILGWMASVINQAKDKLNIAAEDATNPFQQAAVNTAKVFANAIVPFTNIIANVANESLNYTPVGIARRISGTTALTYNKKELTDQQKVDLMTKAVIGNSLMVAIYLLATLPAGDDDEPLIEITANGTGDYRKNYELQADGWMPYSVRIGKKRISYQYTPFMIPLSFIGNIKDYEKYRGEKLTDMAFGNQVAVAFGHTFRTLLDMTALSSLNKFLSASLDPRNENKVEDLLKASEKTATSVVVPNLFTQSAKYIESAFQIPLKETSDQRFGNVLQHIPYVRNKYYDKLNALGEPIMPDTDKFLSTSKDEPIWGLIANKKAFIGKPSIKQMKRIDAETGQERFYTQEEYYNYGAIRGALIKEAIIKDFDKINAMSDKDAQEYIGSIKNEANMIARLAAESGKDEQSRSKIIETTKKSLEKDKAEKAKSEERKKKEEAKMSPQQIKYMNELDAISSKAGKIQYIINLKEKSGTTWYNVKKDIRKVISNDLIKDLKDLEKEGAIPKLGIAIKEKFD